MISLGVRVGSLSGEKVKRGYIFVGVLEIVRAWESTIGSKVENMEAIGLKVYRKKKEAKK